MKNSQKGFIGLLLLVIIALLVIGGGVYIYQNKKTGAPIIDSGIQQSDQKTKTPIIKNDGNNPFTLISGDNVFLVKDTDGSFTTLKETLTNDGKTTTTTTIKTREENVMKKFYTYYPDNYDFVVIFSTFPDPNNADYGISVNNPIKGLYAKDSVNSDMSATYGSSGELKHIASMHNIGKFVKTTADLTHEIGHYWLMYVPDPDFEINRGGAPFGHWPQFMDTATRENGSIHLSPISGYPFNDNGNGTFTVDLTTPRSYSKFNSTELYLMGLLPASAVKPLTLWKTNASQVSGTMTGTKIIVTVDDLVKIVGPRIPAYPDTQRDFKIAYILLPRQGETADSASMTNIKWIAENFPSEWSSATGGLSKLK